MLKTNPLPSSDEVRAQIAKLAYFIAEHDGFAPGKDLEYWLAAEKEVLDAVLPAAKKPPATKKAPAAKAAPEKKVPAKAPATKAAATKAPAKKAAKKA